MRIFFAMVGLIAITPIAGAGAEDCANANTQADMNTCAYEAYKKTDAELNAVYKQITDRLKGDAEATKLLVTAQRAWLVFRDAECEFANSATVQGSVHPMLVTRCWNGLTSKRIGELKAYLHCQEGDLSCPLPSK